MAGTPEPLQTLFAMPADLGTARLPRAIFGFRGARAGDGRTFLETYVPMVIAGALPEEGQHPSSVRGYREGVKQTVIAASAGCHPVTFSRRKRRLRAAASNYRTPQQRRDKALALRRGAMVKLAMHEATCPACLSGAKCDEQIKWDALASRKVKDLEDYHRPEPTPILTSDRRVCMPSRHGVRMAQRREWWAVLECSTGAEISRHLSAKAASEACDRLQQLAADRAASLGTSRTVYQVEAVPETSLHVHAASIAELAAETCAWCGKPKAVCENTAGRTHPYTPNESAAWWDADCQCEGYKAVSKWAWDPRILDTVDGKPMGTFARLLMSYYESKGLLEDVCGPDGKLLSPTHAAGMLEIKQSKVARELGVSTTTVYRANCLWKRLGVLRIAAGNPRMTQAGHRRGPQIVLYVPMRQLSPEECDREAERMAKRVREVCADQYAKELWGTAGALLQGVEAKRIHGELLGQWRGSERKMHTLWRSAAEMCIAAGISPDYVRLVIPPTSPARIKDGRAGPPPDLPDGWFDSSPAA